MPRLKAIVDSLDGIPEPLQELYVLKGDKYFLDADGVEDVSGLKNALNSEKEERRKAKEALAAFEGIDPVKHKEMLKAQEDADKAKLEGKGAWETLKTQLIDAHNGELKKRDDRITGLLGAVEEFLVDAQATAAITSAKGEPVLLLPHVKRQVKVTERDGKFSVQVIGKDGQPRIANGKGDPFTIQDLVTEMQADPTFGRAFEAGGAGGSGAKKVVSRGDQAALNANVEGIADGSVIVQ